MAEKTDITEFSPKEKEFIEFLATPKPQRKIKTQRELAEKLGVAEKTLSQWKKRKEIWDSVYNSTLAILQQDLPEILHSLSEKAKEGSLPHAEMVLELTGKIFNKGTTGNAVQVNITSSIPRPKEGEIVNVEVKDGE